LIRLCVLGFGFTFGVVHVGSTTLSFVLQSDYPLSRFVALPKRTYFEEKPVSAAVAQTLQKEFLVLSPNLGVSLGALSFEVGV
jgi:hypothetical protein